MAIPLHLANAALNLLALSPSDEAAFLSNAKSETYWKELLPDLHVCNPSAGPNLDSSAQLDLAQATARLKREGYFQLSAVYQKESIEKMKVAVETLRAHGWPPVFSFIYDEFWQVTRTPAISRLLENVLGRGYRHIPHIWTFYIRPVRGASGWAPHADCGTPRPRRITLWVPLSDATLENGCIYVVPRDLIPAGGGLEFSQGKVTAAADIERLLQNSHAIPAVAGSVLGWNFDVLHWGSSCLREGPPRISLSTEFIAADEDPETDEQPVMDVQGDLPPFKSRLSIVARALLEYRRFEPLVCKRFQRIAEQLAAPNG